MQNMKSDTWSAFPEQIRGMDPPRSVDRCTELQDSGLVHCIPQSNKSTSHASWGRTWSPRFLHLTCAAINYQSMQTIRQATFQVGQVSTCSQACNRHLSPPAHLAHVPTAQATRCADHQGTRSWIRRFGSHVACQAH